MCQRSFVNTVNPSVFVVWEDISSHGVDLVFRNNLHNNRPKNNPLFKQINTELQAQAQPMPPCDQERTHWFDLIF